MPPSILPPSHNKVQIGMNQALFGPYVGMGAVYKEYLRSQ